MTCADPESFDRGGPTLMGFFFLLDEGREDPNTTLSGPSWTHQLNAIKSVIHLRADDCPTLNAGLAQL